MRNNRDENFPRLFWRGFIIAIILLTTQLCAKPSVSYLVVKNGTVSSIVICAKSLGSIVGGNIQCEYDPGDSIDGALISSPTAGFVLGASLNRTQHLLQITITTIRTITVDSAKIAVLEIPSIKSTSSFTVKSASFIDKNGVTQNADISKASTVAPFALAKKKSRAETNHYYMLNGTLMSQRMMDKYNRKANSGFIPQRVLHVYGRN